MIRDFNECLGELSQPTIEVNKRTEAITRLWKFFSFPLDYIESVYDFYRGNTMMAFQYLNDQARGLVQELPKGDRPLYPYQQEIIDKMKSGEWAVGKIEAIRYKPFRVRITAPWSRIYGMEFELISAAIVPGGSVVIKGPAGINISYSIDNIEFIY